MAKFSDSNYNILEEYFSTIIGDSSLGPSDSWLLGPKTGVLADGGAAEVLYEDNPTRGFVAHKFIIQSIDGNRFIMTYDSLVSTFSLASSAFEIGADMYFRKDSFFHYYLFENSSEYRNFLNTERVFAYFGKIWIQSTVDGTYFIEFRGMKDYMRTTLPEHNQTDRLVELIKLWFDHINHEPYNMTKYLWALLDAREIDLRWLAYIAGIYGIEINEEYLDELPLREWVDFLIYFLKRVGTFTGLYIVWRVFAAGSINVLNVYERWDEWCRALPPSASDIPSFQEFPNFHPGITSQQYDFHWLEHYGITPSGGENGAEEWYRQFVPSAYYPSPSMPYPYYPNYQIPEAPSVGCTSAAASASMVITPHYTVEVDLTNQPMGDITRNLFRQTETSAVISQIRIEELVRNWEYVRPVGKYVQYQELICPLTTISVNSDAISLYPNSLLGFFDTYFTGSQLLSAGSPTPSGGLSTYVHAQLFDSDTWSFTHNLDGNVLVQSWEVSGSAFSTYKLIQPEKIEALTDNSLRITFATAKSGIATVAGPLPPLTYSQDYSSSTWMVNHNLGTTAPSAYPVAVDISFWGSPEISIPSANEIANVDRMDATWTTTVAGSAFVRNSDYVHTQAVSSTDWVINHGMNTYGPITQVYDLDGLEIQPDEIICNDASQMTISFETSAAGTAHMVYVPRGWIVYSGDPLDIMNNGISPNLGYWQVGNGTSDDYNVFASFQLESPTASGAYWRVWQDDNGQYIDFVVPKTEVDLGITEVGLFNFNGDLIYYSRCSVLYKPEEVQTVFHYRGLRSSSSSSSSSSVSSSSSSNSVSISSSSSVSISLNFGPLVLEDAQLSFSSISSSSSRSSSYSSCSYSPTRSVILPFSNYGDNNYWVATIGSWNGSGWDAAFSGGNYKLDLQIAGSPNDGWQINFLPAHARYTLDADPSFIVIEDADFNNIVTGFTGPGTDTKACDFCACLPMATLSIESNVPIELSNLQFTDFELICPSFSSSSQSSSSVSFSSSSSSFSCGSVSLVEECNTTFTAGGRSFFGDAIYRSDTHNDIVFVFTEIPYTIGPYTYGENLTAVTVFDACDDQQSPVPVSAVGEPNPGVQQIIYLESVASNPLNSEVIVLTGSTIGQRRVYQLRPNGSTGEYDGTILYGPTTLDLSTSWAEDVFIAPIDFNRFMAFWTNLNNGKHYHRIFQAGPTFAAGVLMTWDFDPDGKILDVTGCQQVVYRESGAYPTSYGLFVKEDGPGGERLKCIVILSNGAIIGSPQYTGYTTPGDGSTFMAACKLVESIAGSFASVYKSLSEELYIKRIQPTGQPMAGAALKFADDPNTEFLGTNKEWGAFDCEEMCDGRILVVGWVRVHNPPTYLSGTLYYWIINELTDTVDVGPTQIDFQPSFIWSNVKVVSNEVKSNFTIYTMQDNAYPDRQKIIELIIP